MCKVRPERGLKTFLVPAMEAVERLLEEVDVGAEDKVDEELKFNLLVISECIRVHGRHLVPYLDREGLIEANRRRS